jgi:glycosyltransferase involved in cell wall biosynthesis
MEHPHWLLLPLWLRLKRLKNFTWVKICHDATLPSRHDKMSLSEKRLFQDALTAIDELVVYSKELETWFRAKRYAGVIRFMPFLTPLEPEWASSPASDILAGAIHEKVVSSVGVFLPFYGFDKLARAVESVRNKHNIDIRLVLLDGGFARDESYRSSVLRNRPWIRVVQELPHPQIGSVIAASNVFVRPVEHESYGRSRAEAIMTGVPVIATNVGETRGVVTYDFADVTALERHLENVLLGKTDVDVSAWRDTYVAEATSNLTTYVQLITGEFDA